MYVDGAEVTDQSKFSALAFMNADASAAYMPNMAVNGKATNCAGGIGQNAQGCVQLNPLAGGAKYTGSTLRTKLHIGARVDLQAQRHIHATIASVQVSTKSICAG